MLTELAFASILGTGDGSQARPWTVLRIADKDDVLRLLKRPPTRQELVVSGTRRLDRHGHADGSESWFDVSLVPAG